MSSADRLPADARAIRRIEAALSAAFADAGYEEVIVPLVEDEDVYVSGAELRVVSGTEVLGLRADFTGPVARMVSTRLREVEGPIRLCYRGVLFRGGRQQWQAGCEGFALGVGADVEIVRVALDAVRRAGVEGARAVCGDAGAIEALAPGALANPELRQALDRRDADALRSIPALASILRKPTPTEALSLLAQQLGDAVVLDPAHIRAFPYYTGLVFDLYAPGFPKPIGGGGRYDGLCGRYGRARPAVGFSVDVELLARGAA